MSFKFLQSSSTFSETQLLKSKYLIPILESYNNLILESDKIDIKNTKKYMVPNNNNKFYLFITNKIDTTNNKNDTKYKILYFFPSNDPNQKNNLFKHLITDFYVEIDANISKFNKKNYLFEGFLYNKDSFNTFLISDILSIDNKIIDCNYTLRYTLVNDIIREQNLSNLNGHLNIGIHSMFEYNDDTDDNQNNNIHILSMFKSNFEFNDDIDSVQIIDNNNLVKTNTEHINLDHKKQTIKKITKGKFIDVYDVANITTNNKEGILYIKTIIDSKDIRKKFEENEQKGIFFIDILCEYNQHFKKWQITI